MLQFLAQHSVCIDGNTPKEQVDNFLATRSTLSVA
jgi:hypothetical protein